jgi:hypothetical protein
MRLARCLREPQLHAKLSPVFTNVFNVVVRRREIFIAVLKTNFRHRIERNQARDFVVNRKKFREVMNSPFSSSSGTHSCTIVSFH